MYCCCLLRFIVFLKFSILNQKVLPLLYLDQKITTSWSISKATKSSHGLCHVVKLLEHFHNSGKGALVKISVVVFHFFNFLLLLHVATFERQNLDNASLECSNTCVILTVFRCDYCKSLQV